MCHPEPQLQHNVEHWCKEEPQQATRMIMFATDVPRELNPLEYICSVHDRRTEDATEERKICSVHDTD